MHKKIICFTDSLGSGGAQRQLCGLSVLLNNKGYKVKVATYYDAPFYKEYLNKNNIEHELIPNSSAPITRLISVYRYFKRENPDWVIAYQETPSLIASFVKASGIKYKLIVSERNTTQCHGFKEKVRFFLYRWADKIVPNCYAQEDILLSRYDWMKPKMQTITNFVDLNHFSFVTKVRSEIPKIAIVASIWPSKNTLGLVEAICRLKAKGILCQVMWYGYSEAHKDYFDQAMHLINKYDLSNYIELLPKTKQIKDVYISCDYFCLPSFYEGTPNVIAEAMSTGRPILCSNVCDNPRYVIEGVNGYLFDPNNPDDIAEQIIKVLSISDKEYSQMCRESRKRAEDMLSVDTFINKYNEILNG